MSKDKSNPQQIGQFPSTNLNDYILQEKIGNGSFGKVYRVKEKHTGSIYAAKISIDYIDGTSQSLYTNISREINIISKLNHPSVLKFILYSPFNFKQKPKPVIITEYASNGSLSQLIEHDRNYPKNQILNDTIKLKIIYGIASSMSYIHKHDILHRDLKPDNILLDKYLFPKVADFGLSKSCIVDQEKSYATKSAVGTIKGTPIYMSPEIWAKSDYSKFGDVYAFSIVVYEIMTLQKPFPSVDFFNLGIKVKNGGRPSFDVFVPDAYKSLICRCWSQEAKNRPTFDQILIELRTNKEYITETVNEGEYLAYMKFIDEYETSFESEKTVIPSSFKHYRKDFLNRIKSDEKTIKIIDDYMCSVNHFPFEYFKNLSNESQRIVKEAEEGNSKSQFDVGVNLIEGRFDFPIDVKNGLDFLKRSINNGNKSALVYYILMLIKGNLIPENYKLARKLIDTKFLNDESTRLFLYGKLFKRLKRYSESAEYFKRSIELNNSQSMYEYAELLRKNLFHPTTSENFIQFYKKSIELGNTQSMYKFGLHLIKSEETSNEGFTLIKEASDKNNAKAMYYYATMLEKEEKSSSSNIKENESMKYFKKSADEGHIESMNKYGIKLLKYIQSLQTYENKEEALYYIKKACAKGCFQSMFEYGFLLTKGDIDVPINPKEGAKYIKIACDNGFVDAMVWYGTLLRDGNGVEANIEEAIKYYKIGIEKGSALAMNEYGFMLMNGLGIEINYKEAIKYYKMAIDKGYDMAMNNYAYMLLNGLGIEFNYKEAIKYYKMAIDKGNDLAMYSYAYMLLNGIGVEINYKEAIKYYKMAIDKGNDMAMNSYALMLMNGLGIEIDYREAIKYYKMAIKKGNGFAMSNYGYMNMLGLGIDVNYEEAIKYFKMAIDKGVDGAMTNYGRMLRDGLGVEVNYNEAIKYFKMAIDKNVPSGWNYYANMLENGLGVDIDIDEAIKNYKISIDKGFALAMVNYANLLYKGKGVQVNKEEAVKYYKLAIYKGCPEAMLTYGLILYQEGESENIKEEGLSLIKKAADRDFADALYEYGRILEVDNINDISKNDFIYYYEKASNKGNKDAIKALQRIKSTNI